MKVIKNIIFYRLSEKIFFCFNIFRSKRLLELQSWWLTNYTMMIKIIINGSKEGDHVQALKLC